jgi:hypothetical protein
MKHHELIIYEEADNSFFQYWWRKNVSIQFEEALCRLCSYRCHLPSFSLQGEFVRKFVVIGYSSIDAAVNSRYCTNDHTIIMSTQSTKKKIGRTEEAVWESSLCIILSTTHITLFEGACDNILIYILRRANIKRNSIDMVDDMVDGVQIVWDGKRMPHGNGEWCDGRGKNWSSETVKRWKTATLVALVEEESQQGMDSGVW